MYPLLTCSAKNKEILGVISGLRGFPLDDRHTAVCCRPILAATYMLYPCLGSSVRLIPMPQPVGAKGGLEP